MVTMTLNNLSVLLKILIIKIFMNNVGFVVFVSVYELLIILTYISYIKFVKSYVNLFANTAYLVIIVVL